MVWENDQPTTITRAEAIAEIKAIADDRGIHGSFKVYYQNTLVNTPNDLPEHVNMNDVRISAMMDQA